VAAFIREAVRCTDAAMTIMRKVARLVACNFPLVIGSRPETNPVSWIKVCKADENSPVPGEDSEVQRQQRHHQSDVTGFDDYGY
jgi:hypothetical protein